MTPNSPTCTLQGIEYQFLPTLRCRSCAWKSRLATIVHYRDGVQGRQNQVHQPGAIFERIPGVSLCLSSQICTNFIPLLNLHAKPASRLNSEETLQSPGTSTSTSSQRPKTASSVHGGLFTVLSPATLGLTSRFLYCISFFRRDSRSSS